MEQSHTALGVEEFSGSLSWDEFVLAIDALSKVPDALGDSWTLECPQPGIAGGSFLSHTRYTMINNSILKCDYHIVYSFSYAVPVIYFNMSSSSGKLLPVEDVGLYFKKSIYELSQQEHPVLRVPFLCLHPCHTSEIMKSLSHLKHKSSLNYLISWLSLVAQVLHIPIPNELGYSGNGGGAGDFGEHYSAHEQRYMAGLFILKNGKLTEHGSQDHDFSNHGADVSELLNSACVGMMNEADIMTGISLGKVNESMIRVASTYFPKLLTRVLETYARQLLTQEEKLRAMNYFLLINQPEQAIRALTLQKEYYRQAIVLSKIFTPKKVDELSKDAAAHFLKICSYQIAHELYCSNGNYAEALASLETLNTAQATIASEFVAKKLKCDETESEVLGNRLGELTLDNAEKEPVFAA